MTRHLLPALLLLFAVTGCRQKKEAAGTTASNPIVLDTLHVSAQPTSSVEVYRGSNALPNDLVHTRLEVNFDWWNSRLNGKAELELRPYFYPVSSVALNARGMEIRSVEVQAAIESAEAQAAGEAAQTTPIRRKIESASYTYEKDSLFIQLGATFSRSQHYFVLIEYVAKPEELGKSGGSAAIIDDKGLYFINPRGENPFRMPQIWTQGETQANSAWFPTIDSPNEKMTQEILITVEDKYTTLSNGALVTSVKNADGTRTDHWKQDKPHAPYLTMMAIGEFVKVTGEPWNGKEISYYVEKEYAADAKAIFAETTEMVDYYSRILGVQYPWDKYAQVVVREYVSGAMENTSATLHGDFMVYQTEREIADERKGTAVIAHELFHQWFGDLVTCESWSNLPLNESFATYGEYLWYEYKYGREAADEHRWQSRQGYIHSRQEADLIRYHYRDKEDMFDAISYNKGGQVMHMLRQAVGDEAFFAGLKKYLETNAFKPVEIHHLRLAFEEVTGRDLNWFFNQWFFAKGRPKLRVSTKYLEEKQQLRLIIEQRQDLSQVPLYRLPVLVEMNEDDGDFRDTIVISKAIDTFYLSAKIPPGTVNFDPGRQLLADVEYARTTAELIGQYNGGRFFADRMEALMLLEPKIQDSAVFLLFRKAALRDSRPFIRNYAITRLEKSSPSYADELKSLLTQIFLSDSSGSVRSVALTVLNRRFLNDPQVSNMSDNALDDRSPAVCAEALTSLSKRDPAEALRKSLKFSKERSRDIIMAVTSLYGIHGSDGHIGFFRHAMPYVTGFDILPFCASYAKLAQRCNIPGSVLTIAADLENLGKGSGKYTRYGVTKGLKELSAFYDQKEASLKQKVQSNATAEEEKSLRDASEIAVKLRAIYERARQ